jgi:methylated-DNA-[protein]-cysteine S-methyltransferase
VKFGLASEHASTSAMHRFDATKSLPLTSTFREGDEAAPTTGHPLTASCAERMSSIGYASTPLGPVRVVTSGQDLVGLCFDGGERMPRTSGLADRRPDALRAVRTQLGEYFAGSRRTFDLPLRLEGTPFQLEVWAALLDLPLGMVATYGEIARQLGRPLAARAVGAANGRNPISIVVPCHRLVGSAGDLTGYGGGLDRKRWLLSHERRVSGGAPAEPRDRPAISVAPG